MSSTICGSMWCFRRRSREFPLNEMLDPRRNHKISRLAVPRVEMRYSKHHLFLDNRPPVVPKGAHMPEDGYVLARLEAGCGPRDQPSLPKPDMSQRLHP